MGAGAYVNIELIPTIAENRGRHPQVLRDTHH